MTEETEGGHSGEEETWQLDYLPTWGGMRARGDRAAVRRLAQCGSEASILQREIEVSRAHASLAAPRW